ncbi:MAG: EVE domain-containing protein [Nakamurella sp.]
MSDHLGVVSAAHVRRGVALGIAQIAHGKRPPLARMQAGDRLVYYSPREQLGEPATLRAFTAIGTIADDEIWQADEGTFQPWRRRVTYLRGTPVPLTEVQDQLELTRHPNWGYQLRRGLVPLSVADTELLLAHFTGPA